MTDITTEEQPQEVVEEIMQDILRAWSSPDGINHLTEKGDGGVRLCIGDRCYESSNGDVDAEALAGLLANLGVLEN